MGAGGLQIGRDSERERLAALLRDSASGRPGAVLIAGESGIGKTTLVAEVTSGPAAAEHLVLWGRCLRFGAESTPYLPMTQILTQWHRQADASERARVLTGAERLGSIAPALGVAPDDVDTARVLPLVAAVLDRIAERGPLTLVVDDAQWADATSLNLLAYLVAGFHAGPRTCLMITYRDTELREGHRLHGWLADVTRLPSMSRLRLERLGFADTEELVARMTREGAAKGQDAAEVFAKARGNPYYTELLARGPDSGTGTQWDGLEQALLSSWHLLDPDARELLQLLAVGGRPVALVVLQQLFAARGRDPERVSSGLADASSAGLTMHRKGGEVWFHHTLVAELVASTLTPTARTQVHQEYVDALSSSGGLGPAQAAHLALHHHGAGNPDEAFTWSLRAAEAAARVRGYAEEFEHLHRACRLWKDLGDAARTAASEQVDLWRRASECAWSAGEHTAAVRLLEEAIALVDTETDPALAVRLRLSLQARRNVADQAVASPGATDHAALDISSTRCPRSVEHSIALAQLAMDEAWTRDRHTEGLAEGHADQAVRLGRATGSSEALAWALAVRSMTHADSPSALADAEQALALAREVGDPELWGKVAVWTANSLIHVGRLAHAGDLLVATFGELVATGSVHDALWARPGFAATLLLDLGRFREARDLLRELLSHRLPAGTAADARGTAALLAFRTGDSASGRSHLERARELRPDRRMPGDGLPYTEAESMWQDGEPLAALTLVENLMPAAAVVDTDGAGELLVLAARAAGDLADVPGRRPEAVARLERVERLRGGGRAWFESAGPDDLMHPARGQLFAAERARCHGDTDATPHWRDAVSTCHGAGLVWDEARASYQLARAILAAHGARGEGAAALRHAARIAAALGAVPLLRDAEALALQAHIPLAEPAPATETEDRATDGFPELTPREREVLTHLVAGRTYAEIAGALFISEKTVSVHVSNLLRKTRTSSRIELAELVGREA